MKRIFLILMVLLIALPIIAQSESELIVASSEVVTELDIFGLEVQVVHGTIQNIGYTAYADVSVTVDVYDAAGEVIGEGFGFLADACGTALLDAVLQPGLSHAFTASLELYEEGVEIATLDIRVDGTPVEPEPFDLSQVFSGLTTISGEDVVLVEWVDASTLRYGAGCAGRVFTELDWYQYSFADGANTPIEHPNAAQVTPELLDAIGLTRLTQGGDADEFVFKNSFLTYPVGARRILYQNDLHTLFSAEPDGTFPRLILDGLHRHSLQGLIWRPNGVFLAYYYGAYGEGVRHLSGSVEGQLISNVDIETMIQSVTVPGPTDDGTFAVIGGTFDGVTGYFLKSLAYQDNIPLFAAELPGNNYPAPVYYRNPNGLRFVYVVSPVDGRATLQCFERETGVLNTLTALPLDLENEERAWSWVAPDFSKIAFSANGMHSGLWVVDLNAFGVCR